MFCNYCGSQNPDDALFCSRCGRETRLPVSAPVESAGSVAPLVEDRSELLPSVGKTAEAIPAAGKPVSSDKWATVYGWFFVLAGLCLLVAGLITMFAGQESARIALPFGDAKPIGIAGSFFGALLYVATGIAIIRRMKAAVPLVWVNVALSALGAILRGLTPLEIFLWLVSVGLAIWYTKKAPLLVMGPQSLAAQSPAGRSRKLAENSKLGLAISMILMIVFVVFVLKWSDPASAPQPVSEAGGRQVHEQKTERAITPGKSITLQETEKTLQEAEKSTKLSRVLTLTPDKLIARCGDPLGDKIEPFEASKLKSESFRGATIKLRRDISYRDENGLTVTLMFTDVLGDNYWIFGIMFDTGTEYDIYRDANLRHMLSRLPCIGK